MGRSLDLRLLATLAACFVVVASTTVEDTDPAPIAIPNDVRSERTATARSELLLQSGTTPRVTARRAAAPPPPNTLTAKQITKGLVEVEVRVTDLYGAVGSLAVRRDRSHEYTDERGVAFFAARPGTVEWFWARRPESTVATAIAVEVQGDRPNVASLVLDRGLPIEGVLLDPEGVPLARQKVWAKGEHVAQILTDASGRFRFLVDPEDPTQLVCRAGRRTKRLEVDWSPGHPPPILRLVSAANPAPLTEITCDSPLEGNAWREALREQRSDRPTSHLTQR